MLEVNGNQMLRRQFLRINVMENLIDTQKSYRETHNHHKDNEPLEETRQTRVPFIGK